MNFKYLKIAGIHFLIFKIHFLIFENYFLILEIGTNFKYLKMNFKILENEFQILENEFQILENEFQILGNRWYFLILENEFLILEKEFLIFEIRFLILEIHFLILENILKYLREAFWSLLESSDPDIVLASETWLSPGVHEGEVLPPKYSFAARKDRQKSAHGGVAIITKSSLDASEIPLDTDSEIVAASIPTTYTAKPIIVCSLYRPTDNNIDYTRDMCNTIKDLHTKFKDNIIWIGGDSNLPDINWKSDTIEGHNYPVSINQAYIDVVSDIRCQQIIESPSEHIRHIHH